MALPQPNIDPPADKDEQELFEYTMSMLGGGRIGVEVATKDMRNFLRHSLDMFSRAAPSFEYFPLAGMPMIQQYNIDQQMLGYGLCDVLIPRMDPIAPMLIGTGNRIDVFGYRYNFPYRDIAELRLDYMYFAEAVRTLSADFEWDYFNNTLHIHPNPDDAFMMTLVSAHRRTLKTFPGGDIDWLQEHLLAQTMMSVGITRQKFSARGSQADQQLDGRELVNTARSMLRELKDDLAMRAEPLPILRS